MIGSRVEAEEPRRDVALDSIEGVEGYGEPVIAGELHEAGEVGAAADGPAHAYGETRHDVVAAGVLAVTGVDLADAAAGHVEHDRPAEGILVVGVAPGLGIAPEGGVTVDVGGRAKPADEVVAVGRDVGRLHPARVPVPFEDILPEEEGAPVAVIHRGLLRSAPVPRLLHSPGRASRVA